MTSERLPRLDEMTSDSISNDWSCAAPFYCPSCDIDVEEGWRFRDHPPVHAACGDRLRASRWLTRWYTSRKASRRLLP